MATNSLVCGRCGGKVLLDYGEFSCLRCGARTYFDLPRVKPATIKAELQFHSEQARKLRRLLAREGGRQ